MFKNETEFKSRLIYQSTGRTGEDQSVEAQFRKARTDFEVLKQTPFTVGQQLSANNSEKASTVTDNSGRVNISGEESDNSSDNSEEYNPFDHNKNCFPL